MTVEYNFFDPVLNEQGQPDRVYNAEEFTDYFKTLVTTGIMRQHENELKVVADGTTMQTAVSTGTCFIEGRRMRVKAPYLLLHDTESVGLKRIDRIVARLDLRVEARHVMPFIKKGVASANPVAPTLQRDSEVYEISLASVTVTGGRSYITNDDILDERANEALCGWASSDIFPNYNDATLQAVLQQVQQSNESLNGHMNHAVLHTAYGVATGTNTKSVTINLPITQLIDGMAVVFKNQTANTGAVTLNVNGLGAKQLRKGNGTQIVATELVANSIYTARYNANTQNFILQGDGGDVILEDLIPAPNKSVGIVVASKFFSPITSDTLSKVGEMVFRKRGEVLLHAITRNKSIAQIFKNNVDISGIIYAPESSYHEYVQTIAVEVGDKLDFYSAYSGTSGGSGGLGSVYIRANNNVDYKVVM